MALGAEAASAIGWAVTEPERFVCAILCVVAIASKVNNIPKLYCVCAGEPQLNYNLYYKTKAVAIIVQQPLYFSLKYY